MSKIVKYKIRYDCTNCFLWALFEVDYGTIAPDKYPDPCPACGCMTLYKSKG